MFSPVVYYCIFPDVLLLSLSCPYGCFRTLIMNNLTIAVIFMLFPATTCPHKHHIQRIPSAWAASCWSGASEGLHDEASGAGRRHEGVLGLLFASGIVRHSVHVCQVESSCNVMAHGYAREGKWWGNWRMEWVASTLTLPRNMVYPALLPLMHTPRLPVVDWNAAPADLNGLVRFGERRNLVSARVPSHFKRSLHMRSVSSYGNTSRAPQKKKDAEKTRLLPTCRFRPLLSGSVNLTCSSDPAAHFSELITAPHVCLSVSKPSNNTDIISARTLIGAVFAETGMNNMAFRAF